MTDLNLAGEKEPPSGEAHPTPATEVPVQEGKPQSKATRRRRRQTKPATQAVAGNPDCTNPACLVTCSPTCENLHDMVEYRAYQRAEREHEMGNDPTLRSKDVM